MQTPTRTCIYFRHSICIIIKCVNVLAKQENKKKNKVSLFFESWKKLYRFENFDHNICASVTDVQKNCTYHNNNHTLVQLLPKCNVTLYIYDSIKNVHNFISQYCNQLSFKVQNLFCFKLCGMRTIYSTHSLESKTSMSLKKKAKVHFIQRYESLVYHTEYIR